MKILCTGDIHLGRRSTRISGKGNEAELSPITCWKRIVDRAIAGKFDIVALSGDLIDASNRYFEAISPLEDGLMRLARAEIMTVAVCGNHDFDVLPQIERSCNPKWFKLLGVGGNWERITVTRPDGRCIHVDGWSFPSSHVASNPLASYPQQTHSDIPVLGLLHADLNASASRYAPVPLSDLQGRGVSMWLLGHIHQSRFIESETTPVLYPGSPQALAPDEAGLHGYWTVELHGTQKAKPEFHAVSGVRYESVDVEISDITTIAEVRSNIHTTLHNRFKDFIEEADTTHISVRLTLIGVSPVHAKLSEITNEQFDDYTLTNNSSSLFIERISIATRPKRDITSLALGSDAPAAIARLIEALEANNLSREQQQLLDDAQRSTMSVVQANPFKPIQMEPEGTSPLDVREIIRSHSLLLLEELLAQKEQSGI